ncbi:MAG: single-stranded-DNA-specific exonuclease RecJ [Nodosilinea sp.]
MALVLSSLPWRLCPALPCSEDWVAAVEKVLVDYPTRPGQSADWAAQLLWQRHLCNLDELQGFLNPLFYRPTSAHSFGEPMTQAVKRLKQALTKGEKVAIWGDFDTDGVTATAVLWQGLGEVFPQQERLTYHIPNRLRESHGLSKSGLEQLKAWGASLIVTCDTGSTDVREITYANEIGLEVIVTDHHTLPEIKPPAVALINPRCLPPDHPLATLSGVAVAYKLIEAFYDALDSLPSLPLAALLDLVAIGLIADLVELTRDCRYLAQRGLHHLQAHLQANPVYPRPGVAALLRLCKRTGDRPSDISFGLGPRINAVSRIYGDAGFCVELLTSQDVGRCQTLAAQTELANSRRKALQKHIYTQVKQRLTQIDLSTTECLVLSDEDWPVGLLGLVAGQISQELGRPTLLLKIDAIDDQYPTAMVRGSARSIQGLDLYELFNRHSDLITGFGGHPLAAGLTLSLENLPLLTTALNRSVREFLSRPDIPQPGLTIDLLITVADLGQSLFRQLRSLEPYGIGNPVPKLLIRNAWFEGVRHKNLQDSKGKPVNFIKTSFELWDGTSSVGYPGEWWGHYADEIPEGRCHVVVELDHHRLRGYYVRLIDLRPIQTSTGLKEEDLPAEQLQPPASPAPPQSQLVPEALATSSFCSPVEIWQQLVGLAKYLARTQTPIRLQQLREFLGLTVTSLDLGLTALVEAGFTLSSLSPDQILLTASTVPRSSLLKAVEQFIEVIQEEQFQQQYRIQNQVTTSP